jgi:hypothetical protein
MSVHQKEKVMLETKITAEIHRVVNEAFETDGEIKLNRVVEVVGKIHRAATPDYIRSIAEGIFISPPAPLEDLSYLDKLTPEEAAAYVEELTAKAEEHTAHAEELLAYVGERNGSTAANENNVE